MFDLQDLYQEVILEHAKHPRNHHKLEGASHEAEGFNPLCGDKLKLYVNVEDGVLTDISFEGSGCAISTASTSLLTEALKGRTTEEAEELFKRFHEVLMTPPGEPVDTDSLGKLAALAGVREFPVRVKCATLPWHTLGAALKKEGKTVTTE